MELDELVNTLKGIVYGYFNRPVAIQSSKDHFFNKSHVDLDNISLEKYYGEDKEGFSVKFNDSDFQIICLDVGSIIINNAGIINPYHRLMLTEEDKQLLTKTLQDTIARFEGLNKHK